MKQFSYTCTDEKEFTRSLVAFRQKQITFTENISAILATLYIITSEKTKIPTYSALIKRYFPMASIIGGTTFTSINNTSIENPAITVTFTIFTEANIKIIPLPVTNSKPIFTGQSFLNHINKVENLKAVQLIASGHDLNMETLLGEVSKCDPEIVFFGGIINEGYANDYGCVFTARHVIERGLLAILYYGETLQVKAGNCCGWKALGKHMTVTKLGTEYTIVEIDNMPVRDIYKKYLDLQWDRCDLDDIIIFPFCLERQNTTLMRIPRTIFNDGSANYGASFSIGDSLRLAYGDPVTIINEAVALEKEILSFQPDMVMVTSCLSRKILLQQDIDKELDLLRQSVPISGMYSFNEYFRVDGKILSTNTLLTLVGMKEGYTYSEQTESITTDGINTVLQTQSKIMSSMNYFIEAVSQELEESNAQLYQMATMDRLTGILNHGEIESKMEESLSYAQLTEQPLCLMMMDVDDFKHVNDGFGHNAGDIILKTFAETIKANVRCTDYVGRWGGDEFMVIFRGATKEEARSIADRIRQQIYNIHLDEYPELHITSSHGITQATKEDTITSLFNRADNALYSAKKDLGKNAVAVI